MVLNFTNGLVMLSGLGLVWFALYSLLTEKTPWRVALKTGALVLILSPFIAMISYNVYAMLSRQWFIIKGNSGEIQLPYSPMRVTDFNNKNYCDQFKDDKGNPLNSFTLNDKDEAYCGMYWQGMSSNSPVFIPYRMLDKKTAIYWASPELKIIGPAPTFSGVDTPMKEATFGKKQESNK